MRQEILAHKLPLFVDSYLSFLQDKCLVLSQVNMQLVLTTIADLALSFYQVCLKPFSAETEPFFLEG